MDPEEFRRAGHELIDWIADHRLGLAERPVRASVRPGEVAAALPADPPSGGETIRTLLDDLDAVVVPGLTLTQHPRDFAWFPSNATLSSILGDIAASGIGALGITWQSAPALTEVEEVVCDWMRQLAGLSPAWSGTITDGASSACLVALLVARERATGGSQRIGGLQEEARRLVVYCSTEAHASAAKAALLAGYGARYLRKIEVDPWTRAMSMPALEAALAEDVGAGRVPAAIVASLGTTATTAFDPIGQICELARAHGAYVHVDAAMAGAALLLPECRPLFDGIEGADSISWNPHKWLGTVLETSLFYVRDSSELVSVMATDPSYLRSSADGSVTQYRDWGIPLGRRFRALKLWFQLRIDGPDLTRTRLRRDLANAQRLATLVESTPGWTVLAPVQLQTVCVRHEPPGVDAVTDPERLDRHTLEWCEAVNASGQAHLTPALLDGHWMVRVSIGAESTEWPDIEAVWTLMQEAATQ